ncbi:MAG: quinone-dependent dihydroorotate dehydrogenase, partial [Acidobacteriota bacterium]
ATLAPQGYRDVVEQFFAPSGMIETSENHWRHFGGKQPEFVEKSPRNITIDSVAAFVQRIIEGKPENTGVRSAESTLTAILGRMAIETTSSVERFGLSFSGPIGMAAGFDKNGLVVERLAEFGFGFVEVGTVTFNPQPGNPKPRLFRLPADEALINRLGFNNDGAVAVAERLRNLKQRTCVVGVNIGKNKQVPIDQAVENYLKCFEIMHPVADYIAVNISSPNTPELRRLQDADHLETLVASLQKRNREMGAKPLLIKIAPDLSENQIEAVVDTCMQKGVAGLIATNTTVSREGLVTPHVSRFGEGGVSGRPLTASSTAVISTIHRHSKGKLPVIGVGGIFGAQDAFDKIAAGASLVQVYTGFVYRGPSFARDINAGLAEILRERGFNGVDEAVGSAAL